MEFGKENIHLFSFLDSFLSFLLPSWVFVCAATSKGTLFIQGPFIPCRLPQTCPGHFKRTDLYVSSSVKLFLVT